jgi:preprotein translocase, YajC subunit
MKQTLTAIAALIFTAGNLFAQDAPQQSAGPLGGFLPLIIIFVIFYFFLIRPQQKKAKEHQQLLNALKKDDKVLTAGGIYGVVTGVKGDVVELRIAENVKVQVAKSSISSVLPPEGQQPVTPEVIKK